MSAVWPKNKVDALRRHAEAGLSFREIARAMSAEFGEVFTRNAVIGRCRRAGIETAFQASPVKIAETQGHFRRSPKRGQAKPPVVAPVRPSKPLFTFGKGPALAPKPVVAVVPAPAPNLSAEAFKTRFDDLGAHPWVDRQCRFIAERDGARFYCGLETGLKSSWCPHHHAIVYGGTPCWRVAA